jgi:hypothetical protein
MQRMAVNAAAWGSVIATRTKMFRRIIQAIPRGVRNLVTPRYRPELHYMRGYGPASAARQAAQH